jgi:hypothetical protein
MFRTSVLLTCVSLSFLNAQTTYSERHPDFYQKGQEIGQKVRQSITAFVANYQNADLTKNYDRMKAVVNEFLSSNSALCGDIVPWASQALENDKTESCNKIKAFVCGFGATLDSMTLSILFFKGTNRIQKASSVDRKFYKKGIEAGRKISSALHAALVSDKVAAFIYELCANFVLTDEQIIKGNDRVLKSYRACRAEIKKIQTIVEVYGKWLADEFSEAEEDTSIRSKQLKAFIGCFLEGLDTKKLSKQLNNATSEKTKIKKRK